STPAMADEMVERLGLRQKTVARGRLDELVSRIPPGAALDPNDRGHCRRGIVEVSRLDRAGVACDKGVAVPGRGKAARDLRKQAARKFKRGQGRQVHPGLGP